MSGSGLYDTGGASMTDFGGSDVGSGLDTGVSQGHPYNLWTQTVPPNKCTPSLYSKKSPRSSYQEFESLERYVRAHIFCLLGTVVFPDKSTTSLNSKFLPLLRNFHRISTYSLGAANLAHLYRSLCRASRYNCKEIDGPLILLFIWAWEHMPLLAPIPRDQLGDVGIPLARRWSHWRRHTRYIRQPTAHFRRGLNDMGVDDVKRLALMNHSSNRKNQLALSNKSRLMSSSFRYCAGI
ncbi:hypothetical protein Ahy_B09g097962 [Arachis hypogaea]|uniref:Aminotransferase-like plant mobile domain-containing protein n=1 Tax=Arachis hypogaea TaxID=3818 RepID=A0A444XQD7_ARAHY|nr:hypothetical protein Ahy_B09g097962 [Arachis hypogaea]